MLFKKIWQSAVVALALVVVVALAGCGSVASSNDASDTTTASRQYMSDVNQSATKLAERLQSFEDAVSRQDIVTMQTQADSAFEVLDELAAIEAPDELKDVKEQYVNGCDNLKAALEGYIDLYAEIAAAGDKDIDRAAYDARLADIQQQYDDGISALEEADNTATEL